MTSHVLHTIGSFPCFLPRLISIPNRWQFSFSFSVCVKELWRVWVAAGGRDIQTEWHSLLKRKRRKSHPPFLLLFTSGQKAYEQADETSKKRVGRVRRGHSINYQTYLLFTTIVCVSLVCFLSWG